MSALLLTPPAVEPLSLEEARAFLRVDHTDDDEIIAALAAESRIHVESETRRALITQSWRLSADYWPADGRVQVVPGPLQQPDAARVYDFAGVSRDVDVAHFVPDKGASVLAFAPWAVPVPSRIANGVELDVTVGYGDSPLDVPEALRQAIRILVAHWYDNRGLMAIGHQVAENRKPPRTPPRRLRADLAARELTVEQRERELAMQVVLAEQRRWYKALPRPLFAFAFIIYVWKVVVWDRVFGLGSTAPLSGDVAQWAMIVLTAYLGGRSIEKVARILMRK